jgi:hypothetical protein
VLTAVVTELDPVDADHGAALLDEPAARVIRLIDMPLDETGKTFRMGPPVSSEWVEA